MDGVENHRHLISERAKNSEEIMDPDSLGFGTCIRCNLRDDLVLVCGERSCVIAVHENCMGCDAKFDASSGKFRCPFCEQRLALAWVKETTRKVMKAKRALSIFLDGDVAVGKVRKNRDLDRVVGDIEEENWSIKNGEGEEDGETEDSGLVEEKRKNEDIKVVIKERVIKDNEGDTEKDDEREGIGNDNDDMSENEAIAKCSNRFKREGEKKNLPSPGSSEKLSAETKSPVSRRKAIAKRNASISPVRDRTRSKFQAVNVVSITNFPQEQRKRFHWSEEEEEMLRKGVQECPEGKGNIRWRMILEYGSSVFHRSRIPEDLRGKWRSMMAKKMS